MSDAHKAVNASDLPQVRSLRKKTQAHLICQFLLLDSRIGLRLILDFASGYPQMLKDMNIGKDSDNQPGTSGEVLF